MGVEILSKRKTAGKSGGFSQKIIFTVSNWRKDKLDFQLSAKC
jgi:hypothetical protein